MSGWGPPGTVTRGKAVNRFSLHAALQCDPTPSKAVFKAIFDSRVPFAPQDLAGMTLLHYLFCEPFCNSPVAREITIHIVQQTIYPTDNNQFQTAILLLRDSLNRTALDLAIENPTSIAFRAAKEVLNELVKKRPQAENHSLLKKILQIFISADPFSRFNDYSHTSTSSRTSSPTVRTSLLQASDGPQRYTTKSDEALTAAGDEIVYRVNPLRPNTPGAPKAATAIRDTVGRSGAAALETEPLQKPKSTCCSCWPC